MGARERRRRGIARHQNQQTDWFRPGKDEKKRFRLIELHTQTIQTWTSNPIRNETAIKTWQRALPCIVFHQTFVVFLLLSKQQCILLLSYYHLAFFRLKKRSSGQIHPEIMSIRPSFLSIWFLKKKGKKSVINKKLIIFPLYDCLSSIQHVSSSF